MWRCLFALFLMIAPASAQTGSQKSVSQLEAEINFLFPDNNTGLIIPADARQVTLDIVNSFNQGGGNPPASLIALNATDPNAINDTQDLNAVNLNITFTGGPVGIGFADNNAEEIDLSTFNGQNYANDKTTVLGLGIFANYSGGGQHDAYNWSVNCFGNGDCSAGQTFVEWAGGQIDSDEGKGFSLNSFAGQFPFLIGGRISAVTRSSCNTTITQNITAHSVAQTFSVASSSGCNVGDWVVINEGQYTGNGAPDWAFQITGSGSNQLTGLVKKSFTSGETVTPALVLTYDPSQSSPSDNFGQFQELVDTSATPYTTGTATFNSNANFTGTGTSWSNTVVGGNASNIGCIFFSADTYSDGPFAGANGPLTSWYRIADVNSATSLDVHVFDSASNTQYKGFAGANQTYQISPCGMVLWTLPDTNQLVLETSTATWNVGDFFLSAMYPDNDVGGDYRNVETYTPGGRYRQMVSYNNAGGRTFNHAITIVGNMTTGPTSDTTDFNTAISIGNPGAAGIALAATGLTSLAMLFDDNANNGICWGTGAANCSLFMGPQANPSHYALEFNMSAHSTMTTIDQSDFGAYNLLQLEGGSAGFAVQQNLSTTGELTDAGCNSTNAGTFLPVSDSNTNTWGATIAGGGSDHVLAWCDGTNWTVVAK